MMNVSLHLEKGKKNVITDTFIDLTDVVLKNNAIDTIFMSPHSTLFIKDIKRYMWDLKYKPFVWRRYTDYIFPLGAW